MRLLVYSLDPGITTGFTETTIDLNFVNIFVAQKKLSHRDLWLMLTRNQPDVVVCESFEYRNRNAAAKNNIELFSRELIGIAHLYSQCTEAKLVMQTAATGKGHFTDEKLKDMSVYPKGLQHGRDAIRHFLQWWTFGSGYEYNNGQMLVMTTERSA